MGGRAPHGKPPFSSRWADWRGSGTGKEGGRHSQKPVCETGWVDSRELRGGEQTRDRSVCAEGKLEREKDQGRRQDGRARTELVVGDGGIGGGGAMGEGRGCAAASSQMGGRSWEGVRPQSFCRPPPPGGRKKKKRELQQATAARVIVKRSGAAPQDETAGSPTKVVARWSSLPETRHGAADGAARRPCQRVVPCWLGVSYAPRNEATERLWRPPRRPGRPACLCVRKPQVPSWGDLCGAAARNGACGEDDQDKVNGKRQKVKMQEQPVSKLGNAATAHGAPCSGCFRGAATERRVASWNLPRTHDYAMHATAQSDGFSGRAVRVSRPRA